MRQNLLGYKSGNITTPLPDCRRRMPRLRLEDINLGFDRLHARAAVRRLIDF